MNRLVQALKTGWEAQQTRLIYALPVLLATGIGLYFAWPEEPGTGTVLILFSLLWIAAMAFYRRAGRGNRWYAAWLVMAALAMTGTGFAAAKMRALAVATPLLEREIGPVWIAGKITALEQLEPGKGVRVRLENLTIKTLPGEKVPHAIRLSVRKGQNLKTGQKIYVLAEVAPPSPVTFPDGFDFRRHAYFQQIGGYGYVRGKPIILEPPRPGWQDLAETARTAIGEKVSQALPPRQASIVTALLTGERAAIAAADWDALRISGLAHLLAISGANVDMVALIVFFLARLMMAAIPPLALHHPIKKYAAALAFVVALAYVGLILPSTPTLRALLTIAIVLLAVMLDRSPISLRLVCVVAAAILFVWPEQLLSPSFQMSFAAVAAMVAVFEAAGPTLSRWHQGAGLLRRALMYVLGVALTTVIATLATAPISAFHFQSLATYGVLANALAVPLMTFVIMPVALAVYAMMPLTGADILLQVMGWGVDQTLAIAHGTASLPGAQVVVPTMPGIAFILLMLAGTLAILVVGALRGGALLPLLAAGVVLMGHNSPDGMVSGDGKLVMIRAADGTLFASSLQSNRRVRGDWTSAWGAQPEAVKKLPYPKGKKNEQIDGLASCKRNECRVQTREGILRLIFLGKEKDVLACPGEEGAQCRPIETKTPWALPTAIWTDPPRGEVPVRPRNRLWER